LSFFTAFSESECEPQISYIPRHISASKPTCLSWFEIPIVFGTFSSNPNSPVHNSSLPINKTEIAFSRYVQGAWVAFARDPMHGLAGMYGWPRYDAPNGKGLVVLGGKNNTKNNTNGAAFESRSEYEDGCSFAVDI
jgi:carboxylesterase type B